MSEKLRSLLRPSADSNGSARLVQDEYLAAKCPLLHALMSLSEYDGERRTPATLILFCEDGRYKVTLNDRDQQRVAFVTLDSCEDAFEYVEDCLQNDRLDWRKAKGQRYNK